MNSLSPATQLALLLTARWSVNGARPLTNSEFTEFWRWLGLGSGSASEVLEGSRDLQDCPVEQDRIRGLLSRGLGVFQSVDRWAQAGIWIASWSDANFPTRFKQLKHRAPVLLFGFGDANAFGARALAIVGSRNASADRLHKAAEIGRACAAAGITVVSGGARGVDAAAMSAGIVGSGTVVGVLSDSLLRESGRAAYRTAIQEHRLCLMSEVHPEARFEVGNAMARNRLAYACADAALVIECEPNRGGTWAGALDALKEGKHVYVLSGAIAEGQLVEKGAVSIGMDFALAPERLLIGERPLEVLPMTKGAVHSYLTELVSECSSDATALARLLSEDAPKVAEHLLLAMSADGWCQSDEAPIPEHGASRKKRTAKKKKPVVEVGSLFVNESEGEYSS